MKSQIKNLFCLCIVTSVIFGCSTAETDKVPATIEVQDFIWRGLNQYYLWQADVPNLADNRFAFKADYENFLSGYSDPFKLFDALRVDKSIDRFSWMVSDYNELEGFLGGVAKTDGVDFGLYLKAEGSTEVFGWVRYILPNSDASTKVIYRGDLFYGVNGTSLTTSNYKSLLYGSDSYILNMADFDNGNITPNSKTVSLTKTELTENPIFIKTIIQKGDKNIGYIMYNGFYGSFDTQLNDAFGEFKAGAVNELVLDLRYNSGGSVLSATRLASMILGGHTGELFAKEKWNDKVQAIYEEKYPTYLVNNFVDEVNKAPINSLTLNRVYVLTTISTASASELIINGLKPYMNVVQIGTTTTGKNVGSVTLYDSENNLKEKVNPNHKYAMQPITFKTVNKSGFGDYSNGLAPTHEVRENLSNLGKLGDEQEPLLKTAISLITGVQLRLAPEVGVPLQQIGDSKSLRGQDKMYVEELPK